MNFSAGVAHIGQPVNFDYPYYAIFLIIFGPVFRDQVILGRGDVPDPAVRSELIIIYSPGFNLYPAHLPDLKTTTDSNTPAGADC
jgi:hypothetical protein